MQEGSRVLELEFSVNFVFNLHIELKPMLMNRGTLREKIKCNPFI